jgi:hypothetical protein
MRCLKALIDEGYAGRPFHSNGWEQNLQWLDHMSPFDSARAMRCVKALINEGCAGRPFHSNGCEQNLQWLDQMNPLRQADPRHDPAVPRGSSPEAYRAPIIDLATRFVGTPFREVVGTMRTFVPGRGVRAAGRVPRVNIDDGAGGQEVISAVERLLRERRRVLQPLDATPERLL